MAEGHSEYASCSLLRAAAVVADGGTEGAPSESIPCNRVGAGSSGEAAAVDDAYRSRVICQYKWESARGGGTPLAGEGGVCVRSLPLLPRLSCSYTWKFLVPPSKRTFDGR